MEFDIITIIAVIVSLLIGVGIYYAYNKYSAKTVNSVYGILKDAYETYGDRIKAYDSELYKELEQAFKQMENAMADEEISIMETIELAQTFVPLVKRLEKFIKKHYEE